MSKITDEMVEAARAKGRELAGKQPGALVEAMGEIAAEGAKAAFAAIEAQGEVKVKPLEWRKYHGSEFLSFVETVVGRYRAWSHHEAKGVWYWRRNDDVGGNADSETAAKAAAQADYERRILSALTHPVPARESENARLREALEMFRECVVMTERNRIIVAFETDKIAARAADALSDAVDALTPEGT